MMSERLLLYAERAPEILAMLQRHANLRSNTVGTQVEADLMQPLQPSLSQYSIINVSSGYESDDEATQALLSSVHSQSSNSVASEYSSRSSSSVGASGSRPDGDSNGYMDLFNT